MPWRGPDYEGEFPSLGWALLDLYEAYLKAPSGPFAGEPLKFTDEQTASFVRWYRLDPATGRFLFRRGSKRAAKGKGKSPEAAAMAFGEFCGPVVFDGWDANGEPVGRPQAAPIVQVAACSEDQTGNTFGALYDMLRDSPAVADFRVDVGKMRFNFIGRPGKLEPVTSAAGSREGEPITFAVLDETHLWLQRNGGKRLAATLRRNAGKMGGRTWETTNAFVPGEGSVAEDTHVAWGKGQRGLYAEFIEAPWVEDLHDTKTLRAALEVAYGDARWVDIERIIEEVQDPATDPADARRFYLNQIVKGERQAVDPKVWAKQARPGEQPDPGAYIALGFDGSISDDSTALRGCTPEGHTFNLKVWERPPDAGPDWRIPRLEVDAEVHRAFELYRVGRMNCDPAKWQTEIERWAERYGEETVLFFDTNQTRRMAPACDRYLTGLAEGWLTHDDDEVNTRHVLAMAKKKVRLQDDDDDGRTKYVFIKSDTRKIDSGIADVLAVEAAMTMPEAPVARVPLVAWR